MTFSRESVIRIQSIGIPWMRKCCSNYRFSNGKFYRRYLWGRTVDWGWNPCGFSDLWVATKPKKLADVQLREWHGLFLLKCDRYLSWFSILVFIFSRFCMRRVTRLVLHRTRRLRVVLKSMIGLQLILSHESVALRNFRESFFGTLLPDNNGQTCSPLASSPSFPPSTLHESATLPLPSLWDISIDW